jgi:hypothetical protein
MKPESFETLLTGGHPNSLGRTIEVVDLVFANPARLNELYQCYFSPDEVVQLRTSNALKRISREQPAWLVPYIDRLIDEIANIDQASTQWTLANLFRTLSPRLTSAQRKGALSILKRNLATHHDWIVLNNTMQTLAEWAELDGDLKQWLNPHLERLQNDPRKSVSGRAKKLLARLK